MRLLIIFLMLLAIVLSCETDDPKKDNNNTLELVSVDIDDIDVLVNSPQWIDLNNDSKMDFEFKMSYTRMEHSDCDQIDENDTISCKPWHDYFVSMKTSDINFIADTIQHTFVNLQDTPPSDFDSFNWVQGSRYLVIAPYLDYGASCMEPQCANRTVFIPIQVLSRTILYNGWIELEIIKQEKMIVKSYALEMETN